MSKHTALALVSIVVLGAGCATGADPKIRVEIGSKLDGAKVPIQACYQKSLTTNRKLRGMYVVQFAAAADTGKFVDISLRRDEPADPVLRFCVIQEIAKLGLAKPPGKRIEVASAPIKFEWANP